MRVIGSHDISLTTTFWPDCWPLGVSIVLMSSPGLRVAGCELAAVVPPDGFLVELGLDGAVTAPLQQRAVGELREVRAELRVERLVHEGHVLVGEARHRAGHADAAD